MKLELTKTEKSELIPAIQSVIETGEPWKAETAHHPVKAIVGAILEIPGMERHPREEERYGLVGFDTNGWQWDWWQDFLHAGKRYTLSGSGYHGGHAFHLSDEQDLENVQGHESPPQ